MTPDRNERDLLEKDSDPSARREVAFPRLRTRNPDKRTKQTSEQTQEQTHERPNTRTIHKPTTNTNEQTNKQADIRQQ